MAKQPLILIDAYSQIFRAYYAIRQLTNQRGEPVNAAYVFIKLLLKLEKLHKSRRGAMLFDCGKVDFRLKLAPEYKANRPPMPEALKSQMPLIRKIAELFGWQLLQHEGVEADDLIGAFAINSSDEEVLIVSSDKDLSQLVDERINMLVPQNGSGGGFERRGIAEVTAKFGVPPELIVDYLALLGDSSDNISGIPGIGPKSAIELLTGFGAAGSWIDSPEKIANCRFFAKLDGNFELLRRNRKLVTLQTVLPGEFADADKFLDRREPDWQAITEICRDNQFNSILKELPLLPAVEEKTQFEDDLFSFTAATQEAVEGKDSSSKVIQPELF